jgi:hypothetical protein
MVEEPRQDQRNKGQIAYIPFVLFSSLAIVVLVLLEAPQTALGSQAAFSLMLLCPILVIAALIAFPYKGTFHVIYRVISAGIILYVMGLLFFFTIASKFLTIEEEAPSWFLVWVLFIGGLFALVGGFFRLVNDVARTRKRKIVVPPVVLEAFQTIGSDKSFDTLDFFVFKKERINILLKKHGEEYWPGGRFATRGLDRFIGAHFVRMLEEIPVQQGSVRMPFTSRGVTMRRQLNHEVDGVHIAAVKTRVTIPVDVARLGEKIEVRYVKGPSIIYFVPASGHVISQTFDKSQIIKILEDLSSLKPKRAQ